MKVGAYRIKGGKPLKGKVKISGAKNAVLPLMAGSILLEGKVLLKSVPLLRDVETMSTLLKVLGAFVERDGDTIRIDTQHISNVVAPYSVVKKMRASILVLGALLGKYRKAKVSLPGGCAIGVRPIDQHIMGFEKLGARIEVKEGYIYASAKKLKGAHIVFDKVTVTGTENILLSAVNAEGETVIENAALEPEVDALIDFLNNAGAKIKRTHREIFVTPFRTTPRVSEFSVIPDRIEAGTYLAAGLGTYGEITLEGVNVQHIEAVIEKIREIGAKVEVKSNTVSLKTNSKINPCEIFTAPYPGFPTDLQAQFMAVLTIANGTSIIKENIFENRFMHVSELQRMGANISLSGNIAIVKGVKQLYGAPVMAADLRASASLVIAGLMAEGETIISRTYHLERGYELMDDKLKNLGAEVEKIWTEI